MICTIFAHDDNGGFAYDLELPWGKSKSEDLKIFKEYTKNNIVIMGWNTFASMSYKPLPNRLNIVISKTTCSQKQSVLFLLQEDVDNLIHNWNVRKRNKKLFIIGGIKLIYRYLHYYDLLMITEFHDTYKSNLFINKEIIKPFCTNPFIMYKSLNENFTFTVYSKNKCDNINKFLIFSNEVINHLDIQNLFIHNSS